jgi:DNA invertase Pin-like site-specific DNA recombinase
MIGWEGMMIKARQRVAIYLRVSTLDQTTANQERELREASRMGCEVVKVYRDHGISGAKGRDERPQFDRLCRDATKREFDAIMAWSVDRLGRPGKTRPNTFLDHRPLELGEDART